MPEAVIVSTARSPIGRANKGSLKDLRPDDLSATIIKAALDKVPALDPSSIDDHYMGVGLPGGESGNNLARVVNVLNGMDDVPGATITRYCSSSVQTTRMAFHAIKAGEGDIFVSAGVETVSRFAKGTSDHWPDTKNPVFAEAQERTNKTAELGNAAGAWHDPREDGQVPDVYIAMGQTAENVATLRGLDRKELDEFAVRSQNLTEKAIADGFWPREITPVTLADGTVVGSDHGLNELVVAATADLDFVATVPYRDFIGDIGTERERHTRFDGVHLSEAGVAEIGIWLMDGILDP